MVVMTVGGFSRIPASGGRSVARFFAGIVDNVQIHGADCRDSLQIKLPCLLGCGYAVSQVADADHYGAVAGENSGQAAGNAFQFLLAVRIDKYRYNLNVRNKVLYKQDMGFD